MKEKKIRIYSINDTYKLSRYKQECIYYHRNEIKPIYSQYKTKKIVTRWNIPLVATRPRST